MAKTVVLTRKAAVAMGALVGFLRPKLAADARLDWNALLGDVTSKNFKSKKPAILAGVQKQVKGKLAKDASIEGLAQLLDALEMEAPAEAGPDAEMGAGGMMSPEPIKGQGAPEMTGVMQDQPVEPIRGQGGEEETGVYHDQEMSGGLMEELEKFLASKGLHPQDIAQALQFAQGEAGGNPHGAPAPAPAPHAGGAPPGGGGAPAGGAPMAQPEEDCMDDISGLGSPKDAGQFAAAKDEEEGGSLMSHNINQGHADMGSGMREENVAHDTPPSFRGMPHVGGRVGGDGIGEDSMNKQAMDRAVADAAKAAVKQAKDETSAAIKAAVEQERTRQKEIFEAANFVRPWVGQLAIAYDSAEQIYRTALATLGVPNIDNIREVTALKTILDLQPLPNQMPKHHRNANPAMDSNTMSDFAKFAPYAAKIDVLP